MNELEEKAKKNSTFTTMSFGTVLGVICIDLIFGITGAYLALPILLMIMKVIIVSTLMVAVFFLIRAGIYTHKIYKEEQKQIEGLVKETNGFFSWFNKESAA